MSPVPSRRTETSTIPGLYDGGRENLMRQRAARCVFESCVTGQQMSCKVRFRVAPKLRRKSETKRRPRLVCQPQRRPACATALAAWLQVSAIHLRGNVEESGERRVIS